MTDPMTAARKVLKDWCSNEMLPGDYLELTRLIAAAIAAAEARMREDAIKQMVSFWGNATWRDVDRSEWDALIAAIRAGGGR